MTSSLFLQGITRVLFVEMTSFLYLQGIKHPGILHDVWALDTQEGKERLIGFVVSIFRILFFLIIDTSVYTA